MKPSYQEIPGLKVNLHNLLGRLAFGASRVDEQDEPESLAQRLQNNIHEIPELAEKLEKALVDDPPLTLKEGGIFRDGYDADLDTLRQASRDGKSWISQLQEREIAATGDRKSTRLN